jgi:S-adenosylmethionine:tRNA ribosyltransferase-isomerase
VPILGFFYDGHWRCEHLNPFYATEEGTVESPLAGLHFTPELVSAVEAAGARVCFVTLHSVGSWLPFLEAEVADHEMWPEQYVVPERTAEIVNESRASGGRIFACGSTSLRALESAASEYGALRAERGRSRLYIAPGYEFRVVDAYFTNFHQQRTSMLVLDAAFAGTDLVMHAYNEAVERGYSFFEFGDAVLMV